MNCSVSIADDVCGVVTLGDANPPVEVYGGPTGRNRIKTPRAEQISTACGPNCPNDKDESPIVSDGEGKSLGNVSRADWIRTSDLLTPSQTRYQTALRPEVLNNVARADGGRQGTEYRRTVSGGQP